ncbi:BON domain-containing protein [Caballeronia ptereochthonis]|uniref:Transport-associated protein n=1 Tax=Caballeronia ptereochthonis TaxID=1777144 RepID=A0A158C446_9BURK|nr:BON domain-containing protein [Caballeronia ptereochthonis]SAK76676.1 transport-associated protein [Caballeronia ptereochthonis]
MQYIKSIQSAAGVLIMVCASAGHAQVGASVAEPSVASASTVSSQKALKAENRRLQKAVLRSLSQTKGLNASNILVVARSGVITLAGSVPASDQLDLAVATAKGVEGVSGVRNDLTVRPEGL